MCHIRCSDQEKEELLTRENEQLLLLVDDKVVQALPCGDR